MAGLLAGAGPRRRGGLVAAVVKTLPAAGRDESPGGSAPGEGGHASALRGGQRRWGCLDGPGTGVTRGCCFWGVFRGLLLEFNFGFPSCHVPQNSRGTASLLKNSIPFTDVSASGLFEGHDLLRRGFTSVKNDLLPSHPLELTEKNFQLNQDKTNFATLRNIQGIHAPLKLQMEFRAVKQVQRLPFLHSSNMGMDILRGNDECIGFEDILNDPSQSEVMGEPHMMMEHKLGLL
nr:proteasome maturation protein isoform X2 [Taeniopygia guttata]